MTGIELLENKRDGHVVFGLLIRGADGREYEYPDISSDRGETERLQRRLASADIAPMHYDDIVRDYIMELAFERMERNGLDQ